MSGDGVPLVQYTLIERYGTCSLLLWAQRLIGIEFFLFWIISNVCIIMKICRFNFLTFAFLTFTFFNFYIF
jgi:hypothetical protein